MTTHEVVEYAIKATQASAETAAEVERHAEEMLDELIQQKVENALTIERLKARSNWLHGVHESFIH